LKFLPVLNEQYSQEGLDQIRIRADNEFMGWVFIKEILSDTALLASLSKLTYEVYGYIKKSGSPTLGTAPKCA
jgi:hypothetical protein